MLLYSWLGIKNTNSYWMWASSGSEGQSDILKLEPNGANRWFYLFVGWDSAWYLSISAKGYAFSTQSYALFPALPFFTWLANSLLQNPLLAIVLVSTLAGVAWIPLYQLAIEEYVGRQNALRATLLFAFFPYVFLFTTVAYSEGLFLFGTIGAWLSFKKGKMLIAMAFASVASISRPTGLLILLPMIVEILQTNKPAGDSTKYKRLLFLTVPLASFFSWLLYCKTLTDDWMAPFDRTHWDDTFSLWTIVSKTIPTGGLPALQQRFQAQLSDLYQLLPIIAFLFLPIFLFRPLSRLNRGLAVYSAACFVGFVFFGSLASLPRFVSFLYPMSIPIVHNLAQARHSILLALMICLSSCLVSLFLWHAFLNGQFIA